MKDEEKLAARKVIVEGPMKGKLEALVKLLVSSLSPPPRPLSPSLSHTLSLSSVCVSV